MNVKTLLILAFVGLTATLSAQSKYIKEANEKFANESYCEAASKCALAYTKIARKSKSALAAKADMAFKTAESYRLTENVKAANEWYDRAILLRYQETDPIVYYQNGEVLRIAGDFKKAAENYSLYKALVPNDPKGDAGLASCAIHEDFKENKTRHIVTNVAALNKEGFEMAPMFVDKKGKLMAFSSSRPGGTGTDTDPRTCEPYMDIYTSELDAKGNWSPPKLIEADGLNTEDNEGTICIDGRAKTMFFTRCPNVKKQNLGCEIWMSEAKGSGWDTPVKLNLKANDTVSVGHPCASEDGRFLIFASDYDGPGSLGGRDLWSTTYDRKTSAWSTPVNMGPEINTPGDELFPTLAMNGDLYYASNGLPGMGGLDIFRAAKVGTDNKWENPTNVGAPINSDNNDYALVEHTDRDGYFTSERKGKDTKGDVFKPDIYKYELPPNLFTLKVIVSNLTEKSKKIAGVKVKVTGTTEGSTTADTWEGITDEKGTVFWEKKPNADRYIKENSTYKITITKDGNEYHPDTKGASVSTIGLNYDQDFVVDMYLLRKKPIRLPEVRYPLAKWDLLVDSTINSKDSLLFVYNLLTEYPNMVLELSSHTDSRGGNIYNQALSDNRAKACYKYLVEEKGIDPRRIVPVGKGENEPRTIYKKDGKYMETEPADMAGVETIRLTEAYINGFKAKDKKTFELLHQYNRRTEGRVISLDFDPATAPPANPDYMKFRIPLPPSNK